MTSPQLRDRYLQDSINTASPGKLLLMLYDRLVLDLMQGEEALRDRRPGAGHERLTHAQEIVLELRTSLDVEAWSGAPGLASLYGFLYRADRREHRPRRRPGGRLPRPGRAAAGRLARGGRRGGRRLSRP